MSENRFTIRKGSERIIGDISSGDMRLPSDARASEILQAESDTIGRVVEKRGDLIALDDHDVSRAGILMEEGSVVADLVGFRDFVEVEFTGPVAAV